VSAALFAAGVVVAAPIVEREQAGAADRDVAVARKVKVDLHRKCKDATPRSWRARMCRDGAKVSICDVCERISYHRFLHDAQERLARSTQEGVSGRRAVRGKLRKEEPSAHDRSCQQLRKERDVQRIVDRIAHRSKRPTVDVNDVRDALKRVKADSNRNEPCKDPWLSSMERGPIALPSRWR